MRPRAAGAVLSLLVLTLAVPPLSGSSAEAVSISTSGEAGEWLFVYQPFMEPSTDVKYEYTVHVRAHGNGSSPTSLFAPTRPLLALTWEDGIRLALDMHSPFPGPLFVDHAGSDIHLERSGKLWRTNTGGSFAGLFFFVASNVAWTADIVLRPDEGYGPWPEPFVSRGNGSTLWPAGNRTVSVTSSGALLGKVELNAVLSSPGWTHLQYDYDALQPDGYRMYDVFIPDGWNWQGSGYVAGLYLPPGIGSANGQNWLDWFGSIMAGPGQVETSLTYVQLETRLNAAMFHMPITASDLPPNLKLTDYSGYVDPAPDSFP